MPPPLKKILPDFFLITSHLNSDGTTDIKPEMLSGVQTGNGTPHAHARTNRKDDIFMKRRLVQNFTFILEWGQGDFFIDEAHTAWDIFRFAVFFFIGIAYGTVRTKF